MINKQGNYWTLAKEENLDALVCTTNCIVKNNGSLVMGAGIAKQFSKEFVGLADTWGEVVSSRGKIKVPKSSLIVSRAEYNKRSVYLVGFPTKYNWQDNSDLSLIAKSARQLSEIADAFNWKKVLMTRPGCGNGGLEWNVVKEYIKFLDERFIVCHNK